jgi:type IX secretion system PorP/SprF family membrane protein
MKKANWIFIFCITLLTLEGFSQQLAHHSQYMFNDFFINPAIAGTKSHHPLMGTIRNQWLGLDDAPQTQSISYHGSWIKNMGLGAILTNDVTGPARQTGLQLAYSYHIQVKEGNYLSLGIAGILNQHVLNKDLIVLDEPNDQAAMGGSEEDLVPEASFGIYFFGEKFYAGIAVPQLFQSKVDFSADLQGEGNQLVRHYFAHGGYRIDAGEDLEIEPSVLVKAIENAPLQFDINTKVTYKEMVWIGCSYRAMESLVALIGTQYKNIGLGYSYDFTLTNLKKYSTGSHELFLALYLPSKQRAPEKKKKTGLMN